MCAAKVVHESDVSLDEGPPAGTKFGSRYRRLGKAAGGDQLQCSLYEVQPGQRAFPFHWHAAIEEAIYVLEGEGTLRLGDEEIAVRAGHYAALPTGPEHPHQLINTGSVALRYLCLSAMAGDVDVAVYPDSDKVGAFVMGADGMPAYRALFRNGDQTRDYFDGESTE